MKYYYTDRLHTNKDMYKDRCTNVCEGFEIYMQNMQLHQLKMRKPESKSFPPTRVGQQVI